MLKRAFVSVWALLALGLLAACGGASAPAATAPAPAQPSRAPAATSAPPTSALAATTAATAAPSAVAAQSGAGGIPESTTPEGYHVLGRPDAPVTLVMYSDFL